MKFFAPKAHPPILKKNLEKEIERKKKVGYSIGKYSRQCLATNICLINMFLFFCFTLFLLTERNVSEQ
jgi:hypothetical protein